MPHPAANAVRIADTGFTASLAKRRAITVEGALAPHASAIARLTPNERTTAMRSFIKLQRHAMKLCGRAAELDHPATRALHEIEAQVFYGASPKLKRRSPELGSCAAQRASAEPASTSCGASRSAPSQKREVTS